ncbi:MAG: YccF domain-containing protein [Oscillochloris sp.]|nr:YccF domain-containing protein [Oscillochloris sp.]
MTTIVREQRSVNVLLRALYFIFFGLWFSGIWAAVAWFLSVTIIGLPIGLWMLNRLPQVTTLQAERSDLVITSDGRVYRRDASQPPFLLRALYFLLVGWWFSALWMAAAWALCSIIIGLPFGFWMFNRVPTVITLARS